MLIRVDNLVKDYGRTRAVDGISFDFAPGQIFGFVGPNGSGKTTTMSIMATLLEPTDGDVFLDGVSVVQYPEKARRLIGFMPDSLPAHKDMTVHEYLDFFARAYGVDSNRRKAVIEGIEEFTNLKDIRNKFLVALSKGMKQRVSLARALVHDPPVLIMDEPAAGLDPRARIELRELLRALARQGKAILISSHILTELEEICNGAVIIEKGRILRYGTIEQIHQLEQSHRTIGIRVAGELDGLHRELLQMPHVSDVRHSGNMIEIDIEASDEIGGTILKTLIEKGYPVCEFSPRQVDLEDIFMSITKGEVQ